MQVCPDRQLLSVYLDGELPSPWKEKMEAHIAGCSACARRLESYRRVSLNEGSAAGLEPARERVWQKLEQCINEPSPKSTAWPPVRRSAAVWRRRVSMPLPAAAAILLLIALAFLLALRITSTEGISGMTFAAEAEIETPGIIPIADMEDVLQYLGSRDNGEVIILRLPESRNFTNYGEPAMIRAADYSRSGPGRRRP